MKHLDLLYAAVNSDFGVEITCTDTGLLRAQLYTAMRKAKEEGNMDFECLSLHLGPTSPQSILWICKHEKKAK